MRVRVETFLAAPLERIATEICRPALLEYVSAPLVVLVPLDPPCLPDIFVPGEWRVAARLFGWLPLGRQTIVVSFPQSGDERFLLRDNGHGDLARRWDHLITLERVAGGTRYRDDVTVSAGLLTPFVWAFAALLYRHRQRRWSRLVASNFAMIEASSKVRREMDPAAATPASG